MEEQKIDATINYAEDITIREEHGKILKGIFDSCKRERSSLEESWIRYIKIWGLKRQDGQTYNGRADLRYPTAKKSADSVARKVYQNFVGSGNGEYFDILPKPGSYGATVADAEVLKNIISHYFDSESLTNFKHNVLPNFRQKTVLGTSVMKISWDETTKTIKRRKKDRKSVVKSNPSIRTLDLFKWYGFPWNVSSHDQLTHTFECFSCDELFVEGKKKEGKYIQHFESGLGVKHGANRENTKLQQWNLVDPEINLQHGVKFYNLVEVYYNGEIDGVIKPLMAHMSETGEIAMIVDNPFEHGEHPYVVDKHTDNVVPMIYGIGTIEVSESLCNEQNDIGNQMMDMRTYNLNPIALIDNNLVRDWDSLEIRPQAKWLVDPNGVKFITPPDISTGAFNSFNMVKNEIIESSEASPNMPMQMRGQSRTAARDNAMMVEMNSELSETVAHSSNAMVRILRLTHSNICQFMPNDMVIRVARKDAGSMLYRRVSVRDIMGDYDFMFRDANETSMDRVGINQMINLLKVAPAIGVKLNYDNLFRRILRDGFGFNDWGEFMQSDTLQPVMEQDVENEMLRVGKIVPIHPSDNDEDHLAKIMEEFGDVSSITNERVRKAIEDHAVRHQLGLKIKQQIMEQQAMMQGMPTEEQSGQPTAKMPVKTGAEAPREGLSNSNMESGVKA